MAEGDYGIEPTPARELQRRAISGSAWTAIHAGIGLPIAFLANAIIARSLGVDGYGRLAFLTLALALTFSVANLGFANAFVQVGSRAEAAGRKREVDHLLSKALGFHMMVELPLLIVVTVVLTRGAPLWEVIVVAVGVTLTCLLGGAALSLTIENRTAAVAQVAIAVNLLLQGASVTAAVITRSPSAVWAIRTAVPALALGANVALLDPIRRKAVLRLRLPRSFGNIFWRFALLSCVSGLIASLVFSRSEIILLRVFDKPEALGLFALAFGLSQQITAPADAMLHALLPAIAGVLAAYPERAVQAFERSTRVSALICGGIAAAVVPALVFAVPLIYGHDFRTAGWLFVPLALVSTFQSVNNPAIAFANARQRGGLLFAAYGVALAFDVTIAVALIPKLGAWGAVAANVASQFVAIISLLLAEPIARARGWHRLFRSYAPFFVGALIGSIAIGAGAVVQSTSAIFAPTALCVTGATAYVVAVRRLRYGLTERDHDALVGAMASKVRPYLSLVLLTVTTPTRPHVCRESHPSKEERT